MPTNHDSTVTQLNSRESVALISEWLTSALLVAVLAWSQFPLGSNRPWSWSLLVILAVLCWLVWLPAAVLQLDKIRAATRALIVPIVCGLLVVAWALIQAAPWTPISWHHPIWLTLHGLTSSEPGAISLNPFDTVTEAMKLLTYLAVGWLAYVLAINPRAAKFLALSVFFVGVAYAIYGFLLSAANTSQFTLLSGYPPPYGRDVTGGFVNKNSFATFDGVCLVVGIGLLIGDAAKPINAVKSQGHRAITRTALQFFFGPGAAKLLGVLILLAALIASASRAGLIATIIGLLAAFILGAIFAARRGVLSLVIVAGAIACSSMIIMLLLVGDTLATRLDTLIETRGALELRPELWDVAERAIARRPILGDGLGTYHDAYYLYADQFVPYVVDRAHNDYLEFTAGLGIPGALLWFLGLGLCAARCVRGAIQRRRRHVYAVSAVAATVLIAIHSAFDFSLQMPAVSVLYAIVLGTGLGQSGRSREGTAANNG
jgi:O-antigen ligase